jgi:ADP-ribose pyrophosphatase YjhB (NUDIX family)
VCASSGAHTHTHESTKVIRQREECGHVPLIVCATILQSNAVLLVRHASDHKLDYGHWILPAGKVEVGETLEQALKREVKEETGLDIIVAEKLAEQIDAYTGDQLSNFLCAPTTTEMRINSELEEAKWFTMTEIRKMVNVHLGLKQFLINLLET